MMPEVSIYYLMAIFRVFLLIIGQKQSFSVIASTKNGTDMKCHDSLKPLCTIGMKKCNPNDNVDNPSVFESKMSLIIHFESIL